METSGACAQGWEGIGEAGVNTLVAESREVMNVREASDYLGISPDTLYRYIYEDQIPAFKLGNRWKFKKTVLDRWMERKISRGSVRAKKR
jgi:excisionase family DNA binding protein